MRSACLEVFELRALHDWPPAVTVYDGWHAGYASLAEETGFHVVGLEEAAEAVGQLIARIDRA